MSARGAMVPAKSLLNEALLFKKLDLSPEPEYISNTIIGCISSIEIVATLPAILQFHSLSGVLDKDLSKILQEHQIITERLQHLEKLESVKQESERDQRGETEEASRRERARLEGDLQSSVRKVLRFFRVNPIAFLSLKAYVDVVVGDNEAILISALKTSHRHMMEMLTSLDEEPQLSSTSDSRLEDLVSKEETVATELKEMDEKILKCENEIKDHENDLKGLEEGDSSPLPDKQDQSTVETSSPKLISLRQQTDELKIQLKNMMLENRQVERTIQEKNEFLRKEIENLIQAFDDRMEETQTKLELIEKEYANDQEMVKELEKKFPPLEVKYNQILEKQRLAEEKLKEEMKELELKTRAAIIAQSWWRGHTTRMALQNKGKGKKAKKGKGKKTKK